MDILCTGLELLATFVEGIIAISVSSNLAIVKFKKKKQLLFSFLFAVIYTVFITFLNKWQSFSFVTLLSALLLTFAATKLLSKGKVLLCSVSSMITWFFMTATDFLFTYSYIMIIGGSVDIYKGISMILAPGIPRIFLLITVKGLQFFIFSISHKMYSKLRLINKKNLVLVLVLTTLAYIVISVITALILTDSFIVLQVAVIFSLFFIVISLISTIIIISLNSYYQEKKKETQLMNLTNEMLEKNYKDMQNSQNLIRRQVHDFKNHIRVLNGLIDKEEEAQKYINDLLSVTYSDSDLCKCGNSIIDSIINCKFETSKEKNIKFIYDIYLITELKISSVDICAILSNQLDNAIEACERINSPEERFINVKIWQKESFLFFKVVNSANENPFNEKNELVSNKKYENGLHGYGIKNIYETAERYGGTVKNDYSDKKFTSVVMILNNE